MLSNIPDGEQVEKTATNVRRQNERNVPEDEAIANNACMKSKRNRTQRIGVVSAAVFQWQATWYAKKTVLYICLRINGKREDDATFNENVRSGPTRKWRLMVQTRTVRTKHHRLRNAEQCRRKRKENLKVPSST